jgi:HD-GYP domain-containing protein (c-di-GMP phosphodiesterase class II)
MNLDALFLKERLSDLLFFIGVNFWYLFLLAAVLFFLLAVKSFKDRVNKELEIDNLGHWLAYLAKIDKLHDLENHLLNLKNYFGVDGTALYAKRGETFVLEASDLESVALPSRLRKKEIAEQKKIGGKYVYTILSPTQNTLFVIVSKKEFEIETYKGFVQAGLSLYEKLTALHKEHNISTLSTASQEVLANIMKIQFTGEMFLKFVVSLLKKRLQTQGIALKRKDNPSKVLYFGDPKNSVMQKRFFIRNTPFIMEIYRNKPLSEKEIVEVGSFLDLAGAYFENASQNSKMVQNFIKFLKFSVKAIELQSPYFKNHSEKVRIVATEIAKSLFLNDKEIEEIALGAYLHDIGMIGKLENFIDKRHVEQKELELIRYHPVVGSVIVEPIAHVYAIAPIIKYHHERYDGSGYPYGLKGKDIPLSAQIVALAEYYVGITSPRAYREAMSHEAALRDIEGKKDRLVESGVIEAFLESEASIKKKLDLLDMDQ